MSDNVTAERAAEIMGGTVEDNLFNDPETKIPGSGEFFNFKEVGTNVQGVLVMEPYLDPAHGVFPDCIVYPIQTADGKEYNVSLKTTTHKRTIDGIKAMNAQVGDIIAFKREEDVDTGKGNPAKPISARVRKMSK